MVSGAAPDSSAADVGELGVIADSVADSPEESDSTTLTDASADSDSFVADAAADRDAPDDGPCGATVCPRARRVWAAGQTSIVQLSDGSLRAWGANPYAMLGVAEDRFRAGPTVAPLAIGEGNLAVGDRHMCVLDEAARVRCWGQGSQLGLHPARDRTFEDSRVILDNVAELEISVGNCALRRSGEVLCWAANTGTDDPMARLVPLPARIPGPVAHLASQQGSRQTHRCVILRDGTIYCWGSNESGGLGDRTQLHRDLPVQALVPRGLDAVAIGSPNLSCGLRRLGEGGFSALCWGGGLTAEGDYDPLSPTPSLEARGVSEWARIQQLAMGANSVCALLIDGTVVCGGYNSFGQLGRGSFTPGAGGQIPTLRTAPVVGLTDVVQLAAGLFHNCALTRAGSVYCWGRNDQGQVGVGPTPEPIPTPRLVRW